MKQQFVPFACNILQNVYIFNAVIVDVVKFTHRTIPGGLGNCNFLSTIPDWNKESATTQWASADQQIHLKFWSVVAVK